ncbi:hypothetical protein K469DRAFT_597352 [Zopfia rhizophila CBS 207.26]|uniref:Retrovirus-related Pol polyprotein from transposon TNT 1-94-like beta-barrel domain-containing protein n=1 Tax=Zopfia rhizophila CBS 207.26 TaxID=1314779 RepID=A0A6A6DKQ6_9PEZI|nr:hypothetical protein K469DRAFT_597352 [Zopfia rhizophila CBS 207.26]
MANKMLCPDWVFANGSNVCVAKDRAWFTNYTPFSSYLGSIYGGEMRIAGIGTVKISTGPTSVLRLDSVLHVPEAMCNVLGWPLVEAYDVNVRWRSNSGTITNKDSEEVIACFQPGRPLMTLAVLLAPLGYSLGPSVIKKEIMYAINAVWSHEERKRWEWFKQTGEIVERVPEGTMKAKARVAEYTDKEKRWLKKHYKNEFNFLFQHGLKIKYEKERAEGRNILRELMRSEEV